MKRIILYALTLMMGCLLFVGRSEGQGDFIAAARQVILQAGKNSPELQKAVDHYRKSKGDSLKWKAVCFLIANMDIHYSQDYYWADAKGKRVPFNELAYPNFDSSVRAFNSLKQTHPGIHPVAVRYRDIDTVTAAFLIDNVERAFGVWKGASAPHIGFDDFCEYILPYRISVEPPGSWRNSYGKKFAWIKDSAKGRSVEETLPYFIADYNKWFTNSYRIEARKEPLPRLGALQLLHRKKGACEDIADLEVFTLRSQGIPATIDEVPLWATSSGRHFLNVAFDTKMKPISFDVSTTMVTTAKLNREPAKVIRTVYSKQNNVLAAVEKEERIPEGFLRTLNYKDVTGEYWATRDVKASLFANPAHPGIAYACVFNYLGWRPAWWGAVNNGEVVFKDMCKGAVFLPMYYLDGKLTPAGYPIASGYNNTLLLKPDLQHTRTIRLAEKAGYLVFRSGKAYRLYYWDNGWKNAGSRKATATMKEMVFDRIPKNALLLLVPEYTQHKERLFMVSDAGERIWW